MRPQAIFLSLLALPTIAQEAPYPWQAVDQVTLLEGDFWTPRLETNKRVTVWHNFEECAETGRLDNFRITAGEKEGFYQGLRFNDSDVHKVLEGAARILGQNDDPKLAEYLDQQIDILAKAQDDEGYLYTVMQIPHHPEQPVKGVVPGERWLHERESHEIYSIGHLIEAGAVHFEQTGKRNLLEVAIKAADLLDRTFGPGKMEIPPGHQQVEIGLAKLAAVTGETRYADLSFFFLEQRGRLSKDRKQLWGAYFQDHLPVSEQQEAVGHSVRAAYQYMAMADIAVLKDHQPYRDALHTLWENVAEKKLYLTGGIGGGSGEGFSGEYQLPNLGAYNETCSSIANILWQWRMFQLEGDAKYIEILERCLYNSFLSGISMEGNTFFYPNKLTSATGHQRSEWFNCACCPPNVVRFIPQIPSFSYATHSNSISVNLYGSNKASLKIADTEVKLTQDSQYPWEGAVRIIVDPEKPTPFTLALRIPGWLEKPFPSDLYHYTNKAKATPVITVNGETVSPETEKGFALIKRTWKAGDTVTLDLPMPIRQVAANPKVDACRGRIALMRGPLVFAAEGPDNDGQIHNLLVPENATFDIKPRPELLGGLNTITGKVEALSWNEEGSTTVAKPHTLTSIPYYAWAHRGREPMRVWLATTPAAAWPKSSNAAYTTANITTSGHNRWTSPIYIRDQFLPQSSHDRETPRFLWDNTPGAPLGAGALEGETSEEQLTSGSRWVQYEFDEPIELSSSSIYWSSSKPGDHTRDRLPSNYRLIYRADGQWKPVETKLPEPTADQLQSMVFPKISTDTIRLEITPAEGYTAGLYEWILR